MDYDRPRHLEMIQSVISRMSNHSFLLKGWSVTLSAAILALAAKDASPHLVWVALMPIAAFWGLDAFYLRQERLYRALYDHVRTEEPSTHTTTDPYAMSPAGLGAGIARWEQTLFAPSILGLHGTIAVVAIIVLVIYHG